MRPPSFFPFLLLSLSTTSSSFSPTKSYFLNCGSTVPATLHNTNFAPDNPRLGLFQSSDLSSTDTATSTDKSSPQSPYSTARIFNSPFWYSFDVPPNSTILLRLHFLPFSPRLLSSSLQLTAFDSLLLLHAFRPTNTTSPTIKEYLLWSRNTVFNLTFSPSDTSTPAFVNAIELFTAPTNLTTNAPLSIGSVLVDALWNHQNMETIIRVNAGGPQISADNDSLWRSWVNDAQFLFIPNTAIANSSNSTLQFVGNLSSPEIAPPHVYATLQEMNIGDMQSTNFNITWVLDVPVNYTYMVRLHFCDFVSGPATDLIFNIFINNQSGYPDLQPSTITNGTKAVPFYLDFAANVVEEAKIRISVGSSQKSSDAAKNAILNGFEIFKVNNSFSSLDGDYNPFNPSSGEHKSKKSTKVAVIIAPVAAVVVLAVLGIVGFLVFRRKKTTPAPERKGSTTTWTNIPPSGGGPSSITNTTGTPSPWSATPTFHMGLQIPLVDLERATDGFNERFMIGSGGFGKVYKGVLQDGTPVAVKRASATSRQGFPEFQNEIMVLSQIRHRHLVSLVGYCDEQNQMILVYEYMSGGPLKDLLHGPKSTTSPPLTWKQRIEICIGAARGLHYLHTGFTHSIIHRDVKSSNILLGEDYLAKVADFGLSKIGPSTENTHVSTAVKGSFGYLDPEYFKTQKLTHKSDVYSFGVVLLEVLCGRAVIDPQLPREQINLGEWALQKWRTGKVWDVVDARMVCGGAVVSDRSVRKVVETAERCLEENGRERPEMGDVLWNLEYALQLQAAEERGGEESFAGNGEMLPEVRRDAPSLGTEVRFGYRADEGVSGVTESNIFSQLISSEGR